ncbi:MAG: AEC family transporter [Clostridia bacterium]|nr:AEC family transporter [Clostridia bacterium]
MVEFQIILFIYMLAGIIAKKAKLVSEKGASDIAALMMNIILPCMVLGAFTSKMASSMWKELGVALLCAVFGQAVCIAFAFALYKRVPEYRRGVVRYGTMTSNYSFLGMPSCQVAYGAEGILLASVTQIIYRITTWTIGVPTVAGSTARKKGSAIKLIFHPCMVALFIGVIYMLVPFEAPVFLINAIKGIGNCSTPFCMIYVGFVMADIKWNKEVIGPLAIYSLLRLIIMPAVVFAGLYLFRVEPVIIGVTVLQTAMPAPSTSAVFAGQYGKDSRFAGQMVFVTTALSLVTTPLVVSAMNSILGL